MAVDSATYQNNHIIIMGFADRTGGKFFTILQGKFCIRVPEGTPGAVARVNKMNKTVYEIFHDSFTAKLVNIRTRDGEYGKSWEFDFRDGEELYTLQLSYSNSYATNILKMLPNVDLTKEMKIQPSQKIENGKTKSSLFISQDGKTLKHAYTKDVPNGLPPMEQVTVKGQQVWDDTARLEFLHAMVVADILPKLPRDNAPATAKAEPTADEVFDSLGESSTGDDNDF